MKVIHECGSAYLNPGETVVSSGFDGCALVVSVNGRKEVRIDHALPANELYSDRGYLFRHYSFALLPKTLGGHLPEIMGIFRHLCEPASQAYIFANIRNAKPWGTWRDLDMVIEKLADHVRRDAKQGNTDHLDQYRETGIDLNFILSSAIHASYLYLSGVSKFDALVEHRGSEVMVTLNERERQLRKETIIL